MTYGPRDLGSLSLTLFPLGDSIPFYQDFFANQTAPVTEFINNN